MDSTEKWMRKMSGAPIKHGNPEVKFHGAH